MQVTNAKEILPVLDEWAFKFYREMDYRKEGAMMARFADDLAPLSGIRVPQARLILHNACIVQLCRAFARLRAGACDSCSAYSAAHIIVVRCPSQDSLPRVDV